MFFLNRLKAVINYILGRPMSQVMTHEELQKKFGLYAESRPVIKLDPKKVPDELQDLITLAEKWGIGDDIIRYDFIEKANPADKKEFVDKLKDRDDQIQNWLQSFKTGHLTDEAATFMYMLIASEEVNVI